MHLKNKAFLAGRRWELTNTRWILGNTNDVAFLNQQFDPGKSRFTETAPFLFGLRPDARNRNQPGAEDITTQFNPAGNHAIIRFDGALPRAKLFEELPRPLANGARHTSIISCS